MGGARSVSRRAVDRGGQRIAMDIVRRHRLWESFLVDHLGFEWDQVHEIAEELEHIGNVELTNRLDAFLGFPKPILTAMPFRGPMADSGLWQRGPCFWCPTAFGVGRGWGGRWPGCFSASPRCTRWFGYPIDHCQPACIRWQLGGSIVRIGGCTVVVTVGLRATLGGPELCGALHPIPLIDCLL